MVNQFKVLVLNQISPLGLKRLPVERYTVGKDMAEPDVILVRSADMNSMEIRRPPAVKASEAAMYRIVCFAVRTLGSRRMGMPFDTASIPV